MPASLHRAAMALARFACRVLPGALRGWGSAMAHEVAAIERPLAALRFAFGCVGFAMRMAIIFHIRALTGAPQAEGIDMGDGGFRPGMTIALCGAAATLLGLAYLVTAGAPVRYIAMNAGSLAMGLLAVGIVMQARRLIRIPAGAVSIAIGVALVLTALFGAAVDGASRWIVLGGLSVQPGLLLVPILAIGFARTRDAMSLAGVLLATLALALQPDRAMAGALAAGMAAIVFVRPDRKAVTAMAAALVGFVVTLVRPDTLEATPFVDHVLQSAFAAHPLVGLAVWAGATLPILPAVLGVIRDPSNRAGWAVFGALWLGTLVAAALGNYPTPLVGFGGSAIFGYMICTLGMPGRAGPVGGARRAVTEAEAGPDLNLLSAI